MKREIIQAFLRIRDGFSPDRVVADPELNAQFLAACRQRGLTEPDERLNLGLLNARKASALTDFKTERRTSFRDSDEYSFAAEIAIRFLERRDGVTLDQVICSPRRVSEFDSIARRISPGYTSLEYRWAALKLRKKRKLRPELLAQVCRPDQVVNSRVGSLDLARVPTEQGVYIFFDLRETLYVGEAQNLRKRLAKHLEHSDNKGLARWLWERGSDDLNVEVQVLPQNTSARVRRAMEAELIRSRSPAFNVKGK